MNESSEQIKPKKESIFTDWTPYKGEELKNSLSDLGITYIEPQEDKDLRERIRNFISEKGEDNIDDLTKKALKISLNFLERGMMVDKFGSNEDGENGRHNFLLNNEVIIGDEELTLYELSKRVSKLSGNKISNVVTLAQLIDNVNIKRKGIKLGNKFKQIKRLRGYFIPQDLDEFDQLAQRIINYFLQS